MQDKTANFFSLFASTSTLICCALPAIFVAIGAGATLDMWSTDLKSSVSALGEVRGDDVQEEILDSVFENFCIGK